MCRPLTSHWQLRYDDGQATRLFAAPRPYPTSHLMSRPTPCRAEKYTGPAIALHWITAALIVGGFALGWVMTDIPGITPTKLKYFSWHKWIGCTVFLLAVLRLIWRSVNRPPALLAPMPRWQQQAATITHWLLYALLLVIPVSGYLYSCASNVPVVYLGLVPLPSLIAPNPALKPVLQSIHVYLNDMLLVLVALHVAAVLKHQFVDHDGLLLRMFPFVK